MSIEDRTRDRGGKGSSLIFHQMGLSRFEVLEHHAITQEGPSLSL
jgi:hypothetical protein